MFKPCKKGTRRCYPTRKCVSVADKSQPLDFPSMNGKRCKTGKKQCANRKCYDSTLFDPAVVRSKLSARNRGWNKVTKGLKLNLLKTRVQNMKMAHHHAYDKFLAFVDKQNKEHDVVQLSQVFDREFWEIGGNKPGDLHILFDLQHVNHVHPGFNEPSKWDDMALQYFHSLPERNQHWFTTQTPRDYDEIIGDRHLASAWYALYYHLHLFRHDPIKLLLPMRPLDHFPIEDPAVNNFKGNKMPGDIGLMRAEPFRYFDDMESGEKTLFMKRYEQFRKTGAYEHLKDRP